MDQQYNIIIVSLYMQISTRFRVEKKTIWWRLVDGVGGKRVLPGGMNISRNCVSERRRDRLVTSSSAACEYISRKRRVLYRVLLLSPLVRAQSAAAAVHPRPFLRADR